MMDRPRPASRLVAVALILAGAAAFAVAVALLDPAQTTARRGPASMPSPPELPWGMIASRLDMPR